ncbi:MAG: Cys-tRNA(Pro) deacylase [Actinobacteria bacterium]|nr:Cys-tRNA(Pro) deacylase [Actinomycetota bacterium]
MAKRSPAGTRALLALQREGIAHVVHAYEHDPAVVNFGMQAAQALGVTPSHVFKTLLADVDGTPVVAVVPVEGTLDLKSLACARGGKRARMLEPSAAERLTGYVVGGISPVGQRSPLPTVIDSSAMHCTSIYVSAGRRGLDVEIAPADLIRLTSAILAPIAAA